jgi:uncharacterized protein (TIGR00297 family)
MTSRNEGQGMRRRFILGFVAAAAVSGAARHARALTGDGAIAATIVGTASVTGFGFRASIPLVAYFATSTLLGRLPSKTAIAQQRGNQRDAVQVIANGGAAALLALAAGMVPEKFNSILLAGYGGAIATAAADTWATEIGTRFGKHPHSLIPFRPVAVGASGGVTSAGLFASVAGAALVAAILTSSTTSSSASRLARASSMAFGGIAGALVDSILGATLQEVRLCDACLSETELRVHRCGSPTRSIRGAVWCNNDTVNALSTGIGAAIAMAVSGISSFPARRILRCWVLSRHSDSGDSEG